MRLNEIQDLFEAPEIVGDTQFGLDVGNINIPYARQTLSDKKTIKIGDLKGHGLYKRGHEIMLIDNSDPNVPKIIYFVKFIRKKIHYINRESIQQIAVWRESGSVAVGVASDIFFNYLLPLTGCIVTDLYQTSNGQRFWEDRIHDALSRGLHVYFLDVMPPSRRCIPILNVNDLSTHKNEIWGGGQKFHERRVIITSSEVTPKLPTLKVAQ